MIERPLRIHQFRTSPYCRKVRVICDVKGIPYETAEVGMFRRSALVRLSGGRRVPVLEHGRTVVADSTRIAHYLEERFPDPSLIPADRAGRVATLLWEDWADESLIRSLIPLRYLHADNRRRALAEIRHCYPAGIARDVGFAGVAWILPPLARRRLEIVDPDAALGKLDETLGRLAEALAGGDWLVGEAVSLADVAVYAGLTMIAGLDGWDRVVHAPRVIDWWTRMSKFDAQPPFSAPDFRAARGRAKAVGPPNASGEG